MKKYTIYTTLFFLHLMNIYTLILPIVDLFKNADLNTKKCLDFVNNCRNNFTNTYYTYKTYDTYNTYCMFYTSMVIILHNVLKLFMRI
jgi:hypothetical protein